MNPRSTQLSCPCYPCITRLLHPPPSASNELVDQGCIPAYVNGGRECSCQRACLGANQRNVACVNHAMRNDPHMQPIPGFFFFQIYTRAYNVCLMVTMARCCSCAGDLNAAGGKLVVQLPDHMKVLLVNVDDQVFAVSNQ